MWINTTTNQYPVSEAEIKALYPNTSFYTPFVAPSEYRVVFQTPRPEHNSVTQVVRETAPVLTNKGIWEQAWQVVSRFSEYTDDAGVLHTVAEQESAALAAHQAITNKRLQESIVQQTQKRLDDFAKTRNYDNILSATTYVTSTITKFRIEGEYCVLKRDETWSKLYQIFDEVQAGTRLQPNSFTDVEPELPVLEWPNDN